ncbi:MAG TPA: hypothetical protein VKU39_18905 [Streptosporangiaceae bacterium]|nr:hypothetical protein [Streptosporangiaceae bacterium]
MGNRAAIQASRHTTTIAEVLGISRNDADLIAARRLLDQIRESLENITCDLISTRRALGGLPGAISELAAELLDDTSDSPHTPEWEAPRTAYLLTAAVADGDNAEAEALWKLLDKSGQADLLLALAAQLKVNLLTALSATGTDTGRYAMARALAEVNADVSARARHPE